MAVGLGEAVLRALEGAGVVAPRSRTFAPNPHRSPTVPSSNPTLVWALEPGAADVNSAGFRGPERSQAKPDGALRIAVLGDSVAFGFGLPYAGTLAAVLEEQLERRLAGTRIEVLDFGVGGYETRQQAELYATKVRGFEPDVVVIVYVLNDAVPARRMLELSAEEDTGGGSRLVQGLARVANRMRRLFVPAAELAAPYVRQTHQDPTTWSRAEAGLARMARLAQQDGARAVLAVVPILADLDSHPFADIHAQVTDAARRLGMLVIDLHATLRSLGEKRSRLAPEDVVHPSAEAHRAIGETLAAELVERGMLDQAR